MLNNIKACIFDMDGTLIDSMWMWKDIDIEFLSARGIDLPEGLQNQIEGMSLSETAVYFKTTFGIKESESEMIDIWNSMAMDKYRNEVPLKKGAKEFLQKLYSKGIKLGIATSNSTELAMCSLESLGILEYFDSIVTGSMKLKGKPAPDMYLACAANLSVEPSECLIFEDITKGIMAGKNAGMRTCAIYDDYSADTDEEKKQLADYYINDYLDVLEQL